MSWRFESTKTTVDVYNCTDQVDRGTSEQCLPQNSATFRLETGTQEATGNCQLEDGELLRHCSFSPGPDHLLYAK